MIGSTRRRPWWLRRTIMLPVAGALLASTLLSSVAYVAGHEADRTVRADAQSRVRSNRDAAVRALEDQASEFRRTVAAFAASGPVVAALTDPAAVGAAQPELATLALSKSSRNAFLTDLHGRTVTTYPLQPELVGRDFAFRDWFQGVRRTGRPYVSAAYRSAASNHPLVVAVAAPVGSAGRRVGYLTVLWELSSVRGVAEGARRDDGVTVAVADQRGEPLTSSLTVDDRGQPIADLTPGVHDDAGSVLTASTRVPSLGWTVTAQLPADLALLPARNLRHSLQLTLGASLLLVLLGAGLAIRLGLRRAAELSAGELERQRLAALFAASPVGILECRPDGTIVALNDALAQLLGYDAAELVGTAGADLLHPDVDDDATADTAALLEGRSEGYTRERCYQSRDGARVPCLVHVIAMHSADGAVADLIAFIVDQREQRAALFALQASEDRFRRVFDEGLVGKLLVDSSGTIQQVNAALTRMVGVAPTYLADLCADVEDRAVIDSFLRDGDEMVRTEMALVADDSRLLWGLVALSWLSGQDGSRVLLAQVEDITARRAAEERLTQLALHDELTGLPNRRLLLERCDHALAVARSGRSSSSTVVALFVDLDGFKPVNDSLGHAAGDQLLVDIARDLSAAVRPTDTVARVGGDEFVVLLSAGEPVESAACVAERITTVVRRSVDPSLQVSASLGVVSVDLLLEPALTADQLLERADAAMYRAKDSGGDRYDVFDASPR